MDLVRLLYALLVVLPEVIKFIKEADQRADDRALQEKVKSDFQKINRAFKEKDQAALNDIFSR